MSEIDFGDLADRLNAARAESSARAERVNAMRQRLSQSRHWERRCPHQDGVCDGTVRLRAGDGEEYEVPCPHAESLCLPKRRCYLDALGIGRRYAEVSLERMGPSVREAVTWYLEHLDDAIGAGRGFWLGGPVGVGKTAGLAWLCCQVAVRRPETVIVYRTSPALFDELAQAGITPLLRSADLLVIDDLGAEFDADWPLTRMVELSDLRWRYCRATIVASNVPPDRLRRDARWQRIVSRWVGSMVGVWWQDGPDRRVRRQ